MTKANPSTHISARDLPDRIDPETGEGVFDETPRSRNAGKYDDTELRGITSFEDAKRLAAEKFGKLDDATEAMGTGFTVLNGKDKDQLVKVPFIILSMDFNEGEQGPFVSFLCVTQDNRKFVVNDGGTGIYAQLDEWVVRTNKGGGLLVNGLRRSDYPEHENAEGKTIPAGTTYYLNI